MSNISTKNLKLDPNLAFLRQLFNCSFLIFRTDDKNAKISKWRLILTVIITSIGSDIVNFVNFWNISAAYYLSSLSYYLIRWRNELTSQNFMVFSWTFQAFVDIVSKRLSLNYCF
jgi:hypothetical protein